jgi:Ca2+-binding RTX toxin-like protein
MTINPFSPILDTAVGNVIQVLSNSTVAPPSAGTIAFSNSQFSVNENGIPITQVTLTRTGGSTGAVSATLNLSNGTATAGNDYIQTPIIVTFADGETSKTVNLTQASQGLSFDGIDSYVNVGDKASLVVSNAMTMQAWINPTRAYISYEPEAFIDKQGEYQLFRFPDGTIQWAFANTDPGWYAINTGYVAPLNQWTNITVTYDLGLIKTYANGILVHTYNGAGNIGDIFPDHNDFEIGRSLLDGTGSYFQGSIDDVRIWNKARTQTEIQADLNRELTGNETGLVGYWNFNSITNNTVQDLTSNHNDGTLSGAQNTTGIVPTSLIINDNIYEGNETLNLTLSNPTGGATLGIQQTATLTIVDDEISGSFITGTSNDDNLIGTVNNDIIIGLAGNDKLDGKAGSDNLQGGTGNDIYTIDNLGDIVTENLNEGTDTVKSYISYTLGNNLENLTLLGGSNLSGTGNELNNTLLGNNGNNTLMGGNGNDILDGQAGNDTMQGGLGNDTYTLSSAGDVVTENANEGTDTIKTYLTYTLGNNLENLTLLGNADIDGTGNSLNNSLTGNNFNNTLSGGDGNDTLNGTIGNDTLIGGNGTDTAYYYNAPDSVIVNLATGIANDGQDGIDTLSQIENVQGSNTAGDNLTGNTGVNVLYGYGGADILTGGGGNDLLYVGSDTVKDTVNYTSGDGIDTVYNFVRGASGDLLKFTGITAIDVQVSGTNTLFKVGDGVTGNSGFGTGTLLLTTSATTGFVAADVNVNLLGATFAFS